MTELDPNIKPVINYPLTLTTLTPICVKSHDEPLSPLADYVQDGDLIHFINQQEFFQLLTERQLVDAYANMVRNVDIQQEGKHGEFKQFLDKNAISISDISEVSRPYSIQGNLTRISRHIHSAGRVYIPGSTLKGMARNALFKEFCKNNETNIQPINSFLKANKKDGNLTLKNHNGIREIDKFFNAKEKGYLFNNASFWGFDDSKFVDPNKLSIIQLNRKHLVHKAEEKDLDSLSVLQEVIVSGVTVKLNLFIKNTALDQITIGKIENIYNKSNIHPNTVFKALNQASKAFVEFQKKHIKHDDTVRYKTQLDSLESIVTDFSTDNQWALVCIGFGKSMLQNTVALSVNDNWKNPDVAPTTFYTEATTGKTIGWCVIGRDGYSPERFSTNYELTEISGCNPGDEALVQVKLILSVKPKKLVAETRFNGEKTEIEIVGLNHTDYQKGDWIKVELKDKSQKGEFKQAKFKEAI